MGRLSQSPQAVTRYWWYCNRCGYGTKCEPDEAWAEADRDHHCQTSTDALHAAPWQAFELSVSHYTFREVHE